MKGLIKAAVIVLALFAVAVALFHAKKGGAEKRAEAQLEIYYMYNETEPQAEWLLGVVEDFKKLHPGLEVDVVFAGRELLGKIRPRFIMGNPPDILNQGVDILRTLAITGLMEPLDEALAAPAFDSDTPWEDTFIDGLIDAYKLGDRTYQIPMALWSTVIFYDETMFERLGLAEPVTWDEFLEVCRVLKENDIAPIAADGTEIGYNVMWYTGMIMRTSEVARTRQVILGEPGTSWSEKPLVDAARFIRELHDKGYIMKGYEGSGWPSAQNRWAQGECGMLYCGTWIPKEMAKDLPASFRIGMFRFPIVKGYPRAGGMAQDIGGECYGVPRQAKNKKLAIEFLRFITRLEEAKRLAEMDVAPAVKGAGMPASLAKLEKLLSPPYKLVTGTAGTGNDIRDEWYRQVARDLWSELWLGRVEPEEMGRKMDEKQARYQKWLEKKGEGPLLKVKELQDP